MPDHKKPILVNVFGAGPGGGNPAPIVLDARGMSDADMQDVARSSGFESGFVLPAAGSADHDYEFRFWVPNHEMSMCGHATVGAVWLLAKAGLARSDSLRILTKSGLVRATIASNGNQTSVEVSQPAGQVQDLTSTDFDRAELLDILRVPPSALRPSAIQNAWTSRVKTLIPMADVDALSGLEPDFSRIEDFCERIGSTGLYPYAVIDPGKQIFDARQFPKSSGYPEDAATGIAAAALAFGLLASGHIKQPQHPVLVNQGRTMNRPSLISVRFDFDGPDVSGCWLGGKADFVNVAEPDKRRPNESTCRYE